MSPASTSQGASHSGERRRNPRLRVSSIVYAQLGSDNGGIVANLGLNGVACHVAQKLNAEMKSEVSLRLRGSGQNADLVGELVWLGATRKEVGICFKSFSADAQKVIANWVAREAEQFDTSEMEGNSGPKSMSTMPGIAATDGKSASHSFSAAMAMARATPTDPVPILKMDTSGSYPQAQADSAADLSLAKTLAEIFSRIQNPFIPDAPVDVHTRTDYPDHSTSAERGEAEQTLNDNSISGLPSIEHPEKTLHHDSPSIILSEEPKLPVTGEMALSFAEPSGGNEFGKVDAKGPVTQEQASFTLASLFEANAVEKWIPPALLFAWRKGNRRQRFLLAGAGATSVGIFALIVILAIVHVGSSVGQPPATTSTQQTTTLPAGSSVSPAPPQPDAVQANAATPAPAPPRSHRPQPSSLATIKNKLFGREPVTVNTIDDDQLPVQVWTSQYSGYYYCADDPYSKTAQPGAFMSQGDALQSGYRPILGQFCN